jgi:Na+/proline symporter
VITLFAPIHLRGVAATTTDSIHGALTTVAGILVLIAIAFAAGAFGKPFLIYSIATIVVLPVCGALAFRYAPRLETDLPTPWMGAWERINIYAYLLWAVVLAVGLLRTQDKPSSPSPHSRAA